MTTPTPTSIPAGQPDPRDPIHPGAILKSSIDAMPQPVTEIASHIGVTREALYKVMSGKMPISPAMALRLGKAFGNEPQFWLNLQTQYDLKLARAELGAKLDAIAPLARADR